MKKTTIRRTKKKNGNDGVNNTNIPSKTHLLTIETYRMPHI